MKRWIDANEIEMIHELPTHELRQIDKDMREIPQFNKNNKDKTKEKSKS